MLGRDAHTLGHIHYTAIPLSTPQITDLSIKQSGIVLLIAIKKEVAREHKRDANVTITKPLYLPVPLKKEGGGLGRL